VLLGRCAAPATTGVTVLSPNGGELCLLGTDYSVSWTKGEAVESVAIELSRDNGLNWETLASHQTGTTFRWSVTPPTGGSATARIRVSDSTVPCRADVSNANFRIGAPGLAASSPAPTALALRGIFPNPARERLTVSFALPRPGPATLELVDVAGRRVAQREVGMLGPGDHTLVLTPRPALSSGVYLVRLRFGSEQTTSTAVVTR
jgi:hypothetical protein